ncbi:hypothetical protein Hanom_Chr06g00558171 [Helianthus anomalus]
MVHLYIQTLPSCIPQPNAHQNGSPKISSRQLQVVPTLFITGMPNASNTIAKAIDRKDYPFAVLFTFVFVGFFWLQFHLSKYKNKKWSRNLSLNLNMWFFHTLPFGLIYQLANIFSPQFTFTMYTVVLLSSSFIFYMFIIDDLVKCCEAWRHGEDENRLPESLIITGETVICCHISKWHLNL